MFEKLMDGTGMTPRPQQVKLVEFARKAMEDSSIMFVQAGTGTGKSYATLATAMEASKMFGMPSLVVAPSNALVNQYINKDAPAVQKVLGGDFAYIKGRGNYLCTMSPEARKLKKKDALAIFSKWADKGIWEWSQAGLEGWGCTGDCDAKFEEPCGLQLAKEAAAKADVIVTNGHILIWDMKVNQMTAGVAGLLPAYGALFVDECHELDAVAKGCNSDTIGQNSSVYDAVIGFRDWVERQVANMKRYEDEVLVKPDDELVAMLEEAKREAGRIESELASIRKSDDGTEDVKRLRKELQTCQRFISFCTSDDDRFISTISKEYDPKTGQQVPTLNRKCIDSSSWTRPILTQQTSVLVSGTIPPSLPARLGVKGSPLEDVGTPFHYGESVLAISSFSAGWKESKEDPTLDGKRAAETCRAVVSMAKLSHEQGGGGTLILFTSYKDLNEVMPKVEQALADAGIDVPVLRQGDTPQETAERLEEFKAHGHAVMGGVQSLWTGVDIPGNALRQVVIYKLPWPPRTHEVIAVEAKYGYQPYADDMVTRLVQGIGRLVRRVEDNGRIYIADSRAASNRTWRDLSKNPMSKHLAQFKRMGKKS